MTQHAVLLESTKTISVEAETKQNAAEQALRLNPGWHAVAVDDTDVAGLCEDCGAVVMDGDVYFAGDNDLIVLCKTCASTTKEIREGGPLAGCIDPPRGSFAGAPGDESYKDKARW